MVLRKNSTNLWSFCAGVALQYKNVVGFFSGFYVNFGAQRWFERSSGYLSLEKTCETLEVSLSGLFLWNYVDFPEPKQGRLLNSHTSFFVPDFYVE